ncbi:HEPN domain-containing protein [Hydrogenivirga sp.]
MEGYEWACFTTQQATEKIIKALGMKLGVEVPSSVLEAAKELDKYYIPTRYPNGFASGKPADFF